MFSLKFISASQEYTTFTRFVPAPYLRRSFTLAQLPAAATVTICGLGFYEPVSYTHLSSVCTRVGLIASRRSAAMAPWAFRSAQVTGRSSYV